MNSDILLQTLAIGMALVYCGFIIGRSRGVKETMKTLFDQKLLTPEQVTRHFQNLRDKD